MKLIVTVGNAHDQHEELVFDLPGPLTWLGVEIEDPRDPDDEMRSLTGRMTIIRVPFHTHGEILHSLCRKQIADTPDLTNGESDACQPIGCDNGIHVAGCKYEKIDSQPSGRSVERWL